jgi:hypothetical protein
LLHSPGCNRVNPATSVGRRSQSSSHDRYAPRRRGGSGAGRGSPGGRLRVVYDFTISGEKITAIDLIADPARLRHLDLVAPPAASEGLT